MSDTAMAADSAPMPEGAPLNDTPASYSEPLGSQIPQEQEKPEPAKPASLDDSIDRAIAKSEAKAKEKDAPKPETKVEAKPEPKTEQPRENGKFASTKPAEAPQAAQEATKPAEAAKPSHTAEEAPARFTETAKAKWASADPEIRGEVRRMERELTEGYQKYREKAERDDSIADFHEMAKQHGTDVKTALTRYTQMETLLRQDPIKGLNALCENMGTSLRDVAAHVLNQSPDQQASESEATIRDLKATVAQLQQQVGGVTQAIQQQRQQATLSEISTFASQPQYSRFEELSLDIAFFMTPTRDMDGNIIPPRAKDLPEAYQLAERLNPAPAGSAPAPTAASSAAPAPTVHPDKGSKSINGAPTPGLTSPSRKRAAPSLDEALDRAWSATG